MHTNDITTYGLLAQESFQEYSNIVNSKQVDLKIRHSGNDSASERGSFARLDGKCQNCGKKVRIKKYCRLKGHGYSVNRGSSARSDIICHKCGNKGHIQKDCRSKGNGSSGSTPKKSINELPKWVTTKPVDSDNQDLTTATMNCNYKKYKWCIS